MEGGYVYSEALMMLAKAYLDAGQEEKAVPLIEEVIEMGRRKAVEARILKFRLQEKGFAFE
jgi:FimV-like protein